MKARPSARTSAWERVARFGDRLFDRMRHKAAFTVTDECAVDGTFDGALRARKFAVLVTFRRSGEPVPSPVWFAVDEQGRVFVKTAAHAGKVRRLQRDDRALLAPSTRRGRPVGAPVRCTARVLPTDDWAHAEQTLAAAYGLGRRTSERLLGRAVEPAYLELRTRPSSPAS